MNERPNYYRDVETCVEETLRKVGRRIALGTPLGLGKANHLVNEFFRRACADSKLDLHIFTALTLARPRWQGELERRFVEPLAERLFGGYPELEYLAPLKRGELPENIRVTEFYFQPGSLLDSPLAQQSYMSSNYSHVVRDLLDAACELLPEAWGMRKPHSSPANVLIVAASGTIDCVSMKTSGPRSASSSSANGERSSWPSSAAPTRSTRWTQ